MLHCSLSVISANQNKVDDQNKVVDDNYDDDQSPDMVIGFTVTIVVLVVIIIGLAAALIWNLYKNRKGTGIIDNYTVYSFIMHKLFLNVALTLTLKVAIASLRAARPKSKQQILQ